MTAVITALTSGFEDIATNAGLVIVAVVGVAIGIIGMIWLTKFAIGFFTSLSKKGG